jgi:large subunit ribosomal protein L10
MTRAEKSTAIEVLKEKFNNNSFFYITDSSELTVAQINQLRGLCYEKGVELKVVKNTLAQKAMESFPEERGFADLYGSLKGPSAIMFAETANVPAKIIEEFRKKNKKPILKAAYIDSDIYVGDDELTNLASLKSKEELLGEIIMLLESPIKSVLASLESGGSTISGLLSTLEDRTEG